MLKKKAPEAASPEAGGAMEVQAAAAAAPARAGGSTRFTLKPSRNTCFALGGAMGLLLLASGGLYAWQSNEIAEIDKKAAEAKTRLDNATKVARDLETVRAQNADTRNALRFLESSVTEGQYVPTLLKQTETLAKSTNLQVAGLRPTLEKAPPPPTDKEQLKKFKPQPYDKLHIELEVAGKYWDVARVLYRLTEFPKIMTVETMQVSPNSPQAGVAPTLKVNMKLTGFIFPTTDAMPQGVPSSTAPSVAPEGPAKSVAQETQNGTAAPGTGSTAPAQRAASVLAPATSAKQGSAKAELAGTMNDNTAKNKTMVSVR